jgi:hypothetical protein
VDNNSPYQFPRASTQAGKPAEFQIIFAVIRIHLPTSAPFCGLRSVAFYIIYRCISSAIRLLFVVHLVDIFKTGMIVTVEIPDIRGVHSTILGEPEFCLFIGDDVVLS